VGVKPVERAARDGGRGMGGEGGGEAAAAAAAARNEGNVGQ